MVFLGLGRFSREMANLSVIAISVTVGRWEVQFEQMTDACDYYQNPEFHKRGRRHAGLPESAIFFVCAKANQFDAWFRPH